MQQKASGIILRQRNIGENDRMLTILTAGLGLIEGSARRSKATNSPLAAATQLFSYSELCLYRGRQSYYIIDTAEICEGFYGLRTDVEKMALAGYFCELTARLSPAPDSCAELLRLLLNCLAFLEKDRLDPLLIKPLYELRGLSVGGFMPNLVGCALCGEYEKAQMNFLPLEGILVCGDCYARSPYNVESTIRAGLPPAVLAAMRHIVFAEPERLFSFRLAKESLALLNQLSEAYVRLQMETDFKSLDVYHELTHLSAPMNGGQT